MYIIYMHTYVTCVYDLQQNALAVKAALPGRGKDLLPDTRPWHRFHGIKAQADSVRLLPCDLLFVIFNIVIQNRAYQLLWVKNTFECCPKPCSLK